MHPITEKETRENCSNNSISCNYWNCSPKCGMFELTQVVTPKDACSPREHKVLTMPDLKQQIQAAKEEIGKINKGIDQLNSELKTIAQLIHAREAAKGDLILHLTRLDRQLAMQDGRYQNLNRRKTPKPRNTTKITKGSLKALLRTMPKDELDAILEGL